MMYLTGAAACGSQTGSPNNLFLLPPQQRKNKQKLNMGNNEIMWGFFQSMTLKPSRGEIYHSLSRFLHIELQVVVCC